HELAEAGAASRRKAAAALGGLGGELSGSFRRDRLELLGDGGGLEVAGGEGVLDLRLDGGGEALERFLESGRGLGLLERLDDVPDDGVPGDGRNGARGQRGR